MLELCQVRKAHLSTKADVNSLKSMHMNTQTVKTKVARFTGIHSIRIFQCSSNLDKCVFVIKWLSEVEPISGI